MGGGSKKDLNNNKLLLIRLTDDEMEILRRLRKERGLSFSELVQEALDYIDGETHVC